MAVVIAGTNAVVYGITCGFTSSSRQELLDSKRISKDQYAWYGSLAILGTALGSLIAAYTADAWGRKNTLYLCSLCNILGWALLVIALHTNCTQEILAGLLYAGRVLQGAAGGLHIVAFSVYISECAPKEIRGRLTSSARYLFQSGILLVYALAIPLAGKWLALAPLVMALVSGSLHFLLPNSPSWLLRKNKTEKARAALQWLRGEHYDITEEMQEKLEGAITTTDKRKWSYVFMDLRERGFIVPLLISVSLVIVQLASGITILLSFTIEVIMDAGFKSNSAQLAVLTGAIFLVFTIFPTILADRFGRRVFLILGCSGCCLCHLLLGLYFYLTEVRGHEGLVALSLSAVLLYFAFHSLGLGAVVVIVLGEIFPLRLRGAGSGIAVICGYTSAFIVTRLYPVMKHSVLHSYGSFWLFGSMNLFAAIIVALNIPETKGMTLEEIEAHFKGRKITRSQTIQFRM